MAASRDIFLCTPRGQLLRNKRIIRVTNIPEVVKYVQCQFLIIINYVTKPRALNRFIDGVAELGASKALIKNKKFLRSDLIEKKATKMEKILLRTRAM